MDLKNPFEAHSFDPSTGRRTVGSTQPFISGKAQRVVESEPEQESDDSEYDWDNLSVQERAIWASVFGVAFNHCLVSGADDGAAYTHASHRAKAAIREHRRSHR